MKPCILRPVSAMLRPLSTPSFSRMSAASSTFSKVVRIGRFCLSQPKLFLESPYSLGPKARGMSTFPRIEATPAALPTTASGLLSSAPITALNQLQGIKKSIPASLPDDEPFVQEQLQHATEALPEAGSQEDDQNRFILIDGKAVVYRAYYKLTAKLQHGHLEDTCGEGDWILTVFTALSTVLNTFELNPSHIVVVFDHEGLTFRHTLFSDYKRNRNPTPDTVIESLKYVKPALYSMGIKTIEVPGVEADDVIGTLALNAVRSGLKVRVVSPDKDFFQLLSPSLRLLRFVPRGSGMVSFGLAEFHEKFGELDPSQYVDVLALMGDKVDNIPGVPGIGEKTAVSLIKLYGTLEKVLEERTNVKGKRALNGLQADNGEVLLSKRLVTLRTDLPHYMVPFSLDDFLYKIPKDGGIQYVKLLKAMGSFIDNSFCLDLQKRTEKIWLNYQ